MKKLTSLLVALGLAVAFTVPSFAAPIAQPLTKVGLQEVRLKVERANQRVRERAALAKFARLERPSSVWKKPRPADGVSSLT
jgi:hypothetical protein